MKVLNIWHSYEHDNATVTEIKTKYPKMLICTIRKQQGFWDGNSFVPWHRINWFEIREAKNESSKD
jgi:hypothetical protein